MFFKFLLNGLSNCGSYQFYSLVLRFLRIDHMKSGPSSPSVKFSLQSNESSPLSVTPDIGITKCGQMERKDLDTA